MKMIARFQVPEEAHLFRSFLVSREIAAYVFDEHFVQLAWYYSNAIGGVRVMVDDSDSDDAMSNYIEYSSALHADPCPVTKVRGWPVVLLFSILIGVPVLIFGRCNVEATSN